MKSSSHFSHFFRSNVVTKSVSISVWCLLAAVCMGCGGGDAPQRYDVSGKLTKGDEALAGVDVTFEAADRSDSASGRTGADGTYNVSVSAGSYKVYLQFDPFAAQSEGQSGDDSAAPEEYSYDATETPFPEAWGGFDTTPKTVDVSANGSNVIDVNVES